MWHRRIGERGRGVERAYVTWMRTAREQTPQEHPHTKGQRKDRKKDSRKKGLYDKNGFGPSIVERAKRGGGGEVGREKK